ncbi:MAG: superoxide dismutase [Ni], partial [Planctomycetota bacterium]
MRYAIFPTLATLLLCLALQGPTLAHCEVPCGIYGDQQRFLAMLEDHKTVLKAMTQIQALAGKADAQSHNQLARSVGARFDPVPVRTALRRHRGEDPLLH